jgi:hypothetical protein
MGNQQSISRVINDTINKSLTNVVMNSSQTCQQVNASAQTLNFNNIQSNGCTLNFSNISQETQQSPNFTCALKSENTSSLLSDFRTKLQQEANSKTSGVSGSLNNQAISEITNKLTNDITNNISITQMAECIQKTLDEQTQNYTNIKGVCPTWCNAPATCAQGLDPGIALKLCDTSQCVISFNNISQKLVQSAVGQCTSENKSVSDIVSKASNEIVQTATSASTGIDFLASLLPSIISSFIVLFILSIGFFIMNSQGGDGSGEMPDNIVPKNIMSNLRK